MKIEDGKYYRTRDGRRVGPMRHDFGSIWDCRECYPNDSDYHWTTDGKSGGAANADCPDLIAEWADTPDLTTLTTPFGLLDRETQEALKAHGGPY